MTHDPLNHKEDHVVSMHVNGMSMQSYKHNYQILSTYRESYSLVTTKLGRQSVATYYPQSTRLYNNT